MGALALKGNDLSLAEITQEVSMHTAQLATMEEQLQGSVNLGLIQVNCTKVGWQEAPHLLLDQADNVFLARHMAAEAPKQTGIVYSQRTTSR